MPRKSRGKASSAIVWAARANRKQLTPAERRLWQALRDRKLAGLRFRLQHPYECFVLDFFCVEHLLGIEVDGGIHLDPEQMEIDRLRTQRLNEMGIRVLRFKNEDIFTQLPSVLSRILEETHKPVSPTNTE